MLSKGAWVPLELPRGRRKIVLHISKGSTRPRNERHHWCKMALNMAERAERAERAKRAEKAGRGGKVEKGERAGKNILIDFQDMLL